MLQTNYARSRAVKLQDWAERQWRALFVQRPAALTVGHAKGEHACDEEERGAGRERRPPRPRDASARTATASTERPIRVCRQCTPQRRAAIARMCSAGASPRRIRRHLEPPPSEPARTGPLATHRADPGGPRRPPTGRGGRHLASSGAARLHVNGPRGLTPSLIKGRTPLLRDPDVVVRLRLTDARRCRWRWQRPRWWAHLAAALRGQRPLRIRIQRRSI